MFVLSVLEAPNTKTNSLCVQTHLAIKLFLILNYPFKYYSGGSSATHIYSNMFWLVISYVVANVL